MSNIYSEFATDKDIFDYVQLNKTSILNEAEKGNQLALRVIDCVTLLAVVRVGIDVTQIGSRPGDFAVMLASEIIRDYEISVNLRPALNEESE